MSFNKHFQELTVFQDCLKQAEKSIDQDEESFKLTFKPDGEVELFREYHYSWYVYDEWQNFNHNVSTKTGTYEILDDNKNIKRILMHFTKGSLSFKSKEANEEYSNKDIDISYEFVVDKLRKNAIGFTQEFKMFKFVPHEELFEEQLQLMLMIGKTNNEENIIELLKHEGDFCKYMAEQYPDINFEEKMNNIGCADFPYSRNILRVLLVNANGNEFLAYEEFNIYYKCFRLHTRDTIKDDQEAFKFFEENKEVTNTPEGLFKIYNGKELYKQQLMRMTDAGLTDTKKNIQVLFLNEGNVFKAIFSNTQDYSLTYRVELDKLRQNGYKNEIINLKAADHIFRNLFNPTYEDFEAFVKFKIEEHWNVTRLLERYSVCICKETYDCYIKNDKDIYLTLIDIKYPFLSHLVFRFDPQIIANAALGISCQSLEHFSSMTNEFKEFFDANDINISQEYEFFTILAYYNAAYDTKEVALGIYKNKVKKYEALNKILVTDYELTDIYENANCLRIAKGNFADTMRLMGVPDEIAYKKEIQILKDKGLTNEELIMNAINEHARTDLQNIEGMVAYYTILGDPNKAEVYKQLPRWAISSWFYYDYKAVLECFEKNSWDVNLVNLENEYPEIYSKYKGKTQFASDTLYQMAKNASGDLAKFESLFESMKIK